MHGIFLDEFWSLIYIRLYPPCLIVPFRWSIQTESTNIHKFLETRLMIVWFELTLKYLILIRFVKYLKVPSTNQRVSTTQITKIKSVKVYFFKVKFLIKISIFLFAAAYHNVPFYMIFLVRASEQLISSVKKLY